jgi:hypothetical protein
MYIVYIIKKNPKFKKKKSIKKHEENDKECTFTPQTNER